MPDLGDLINLSYTQRFAYNADGRVEYIGEAVPRVGLTEGDDEWRVAKYAYNGDGKVTSIKSAGTGIFDQTWTGYAGLVYV